MHTSYGFSFLLPGLRWRRGDDVTESRDDDRDDDRYGYLSLRSPNRSPLSLDRSLLSLAPLALALRSLQRPQNPLLNPPQRRLPRRQRRHHI